MAGIYIHIPFCKKACHYCDFHFSTTLNLVDDIINAIVLEASIMKSYIKDPIQTIYIGGGTPSILDNNQLYKLVSSLYKNYVINSTVEFTLESNPDDLTKEKIIFFQKIGINRLSIGTQSFSDSVLQFLNRSHTSEQARVAIGLAQEYGIENINLDLIYSIPCQSINQWKRNLEELIRLKPQHISSYSLTIEEKTVLGNWKKRGSFIPSEDEHTLKEYEFMVDYLTDNGYSHYEVSNFSKPNYLSKHNSSYWHQKPYLGLGPGAHSFNGKERHSNGNSNSSYLKKITEKKQPFIIEVLSNNELLTEYIFTRIRTKWGVDFSLVSKLFNYHLSPKQLFYIDSIVSSGFGSFLNNKLTLNSKGFFIADSVSVELIPLQ